MAGLPDFTEPQRKRLRQLGVCAEQIAELRYALLTVQMVLAKPAANADVRSHLDEIEEQAAALVRKLCAMQLQSDPEYRTVYALIETKYWQGEMLEEAGATVSQHLLPRLQALATAAREASETLPAKPARWRKADPRPIKRIMEALYAGWSRAKGTGVRRTPDYQTPEEAFAAIGQARTKPFPKELRASSATGSPFREIAGICYEAAGGGQDYDPERAIKAYMAESRALTASLMKALEAGVAQADAARKG